MTEVVFRNERLTGGWHIEVQGPEGRNFGFIRRIPGGYAYYRGKYNVLHASLEDAGLQALKERIEALEAKKEAEGVV